MDLPDIRTLYDVCEATWPPATAREMDGWIIRDGALGGQRVSAATAITLGKVPDIARAEQAMDTLSQPKLFMVRKGETDLDAALNARGYRIKDPVNFYVIPVEDLSKNPPNRMAAFTPYPPLAIMEEIWADAGIGPERLAVMRRAKGPKTTIFARQEDRPAGVAYVAIQHETAMLHALEVVPALKRKGVGVNIMCKAAKWAQDQGAQCLAVIVTQDNKAANALYTSLGMELVGQYHYRTKTA